jgi:choline dehydrogenase-like flavoprotein
VPVAINSRPHRGRPACLYDAWCDAGCPIGALANPLVTYKPEAERAGARFFAGTKVESLISKHKDRVSGVRYSDVSGRARRLRAGLVIGAASPIGNAELLLRSADSLHPTGLGNERGLVGRYMMTHAAIVVYGMFAEETAPYLGISGGQLISHDDYRRGSDAGYQWLIAPAMKPNDILGIGSSMPGVEGSKLTEFMRQGAHHLANMLSMAEAIPVASNQLTLHGGRAVITHAHAAKALQAAERSRQQGLAIMRAAGAKQAWSGPLGSAHIMGGTVMGESPASSVTDPFGRVHGQENLYLIGASVFPTGGAVNPTFTLHATTLRTVSRIIGRGHESGPTGI